MIKEESPNYRLLVEECNFLLTGLVLLGKIPIWDAPFEIRRQNPGLYISQFRYSRSIGDQAGYDQALALLEQDLRHIPEGDRFRFQEIYERCQEGWV